MRQDLQEPLCSVWIWQSLRMEQTTLVFCQPCPNRPLGLSVPQKSLQAPLRESSPLCVSVPLPSAAPLSLSVLFSFLLVLEFSLSQPSCGSG